MSEDKTQLWDNEEHLRGGYMVGVVQNMVSKRKLEVRLLWTYYLT